MGKLQRVFTALASVLAAALIVPAVLVVVLFGGAFFTVLGLVATVLAGVTVIGAGIYEHLTSNDPP